MFVTIEATPLSSTPKSIKLAAFDKHDRLTYVWLPRSNLTSAAKREGSEDWRYTVPLWWARQHNLKEQ